MTTIPALIQSTFVLRLISDKSLQITQSFHALQFIDWPPLQLLCENFKDYNLNS